MKDKSFKILIGIIAVDLTLQTINQIGLFPIAYAQIFPPREPIDALRIAICESDGLRCGTISGSYSDGPLQVEID